MKTKSLRKSLLVALASLLLLGSSGLQAADVFYETKLQEGREDLEAGELESALQKLEIACFGFLEEPEILAEGLVLTMMAQDRLGDLGELRRTFDRINEIEERFEAVRLADLDEATRQAFEETVVRRISERVLAASSFRSLVIAKLETELESMPPRRMRIELEKQIEAEPANPKWPVRLAALELEEGRSKEALIWADQAVALGETLPCLRGVALADLKRDGEAVLELATCPEVGTRLDWTAAALKAHVRLDDWQAAEELLERCSDEVLADRDIERIAKRVRKKAEEASETEASDESYALAEPPAALEAKVPELEPAGEQPEGQDAVEGDLGSSEQAELQQARSLLRSARTVEELRAAAELSYPLAERFPESQDAQLVAGEIAYRSARWEEASRYFRRAGDPGSTRPALLFYMAVSFYESGDLERSRLALSRCLPNLHRTPYVDSYIEKIGERTDEDEAAKSSFCRDSVGQSA